MRALIAALASLLRRCKRLFLRRYLDRRRVAFLLARPFKRRVVKDHCARDSPPTAETNYVVAIRFFAP